MGDKKFFDLLQVYRGIAALLVVIHHTYASFAYFHGLDFPMLKFLASVGKLGVDFFFVLSGFIIAYTTFQYRGDKSYLKKYIANRLIRIYIPYLPISVTMIVLYSLFPSMSNSERGFNLLTSLTLFPQGNPALSVAWTLTFEMFFYLIYAINFFSKKAWFFVLPIWIIGIITGNIFGFTETNVFTHIIFNYYNIEFIFGVFVAYLVLLNLKKHDHFLLFAGITFLVMFLVLKYFGIHWFPFFQNYLFCIAASIFVYLGVVFWNQRINEKHIFMLIGNSSYSLYLVHNPLQSLLVRLFPKFSNQWLILSECFIVVLLCIIFGYGYY